MQTATFRRHLDRCIDLAKSERVVLMCAEAAPWRCHRSLIADALLVRGIAAREITSGVRVRAARADALGASELDGARSPPKPAASAIETVAPPRGAAKSFLVGPHHRRIDDVFGDEPHL
jgi:hypothetical protein